MKQCGQCGAEFKPRRADSRFCCDYCRREWHKANDKRLKPDVRERDIEKYLVEQVKKLGGEVRKVQWIGRRGAPDRLVMLPKRSRGDLSDRPFMALAVALGSVPEVVEPATIWVELKAPGKKPEPHQFREHERLRRMGQRVEVIDSMEGVDALLS